MTYLNFLILLLLALLPTRPAIAAAPPLAEIHVVGNDWNASSEDAAKVLDSTANQLLAFFPGRKLAAVRVSHRDGVPITLDAKGPNGEYQVKLGANSTFWAQYTYQFAHELCHILANYDKHHGGRNQWFEESLCETSSLFVLSRMHQAWDKEPPYPNWKDWGVHFDQYLNEILARRTRRLPPDMTMLMWITANLPDLAAERELTSRSMLVAAYMLPIFQDDPEGWESLNWLNLGEKDDELDFEQYLRGWRERVPEKHKAFVGKIESLFGYKL